MAQKVVVTLICDVTEGEAVETVGFAVRGVGYEIDLAEPVLREFDAALEKFVRHARPVKPRGGKASVGARRGDSTASIRQGREQSAAVREWARKQGMQVSDRGRISREVQEKFDSAHALAAVG